MRLMRRRMGRAWRTLMGQVQRLRFQMDGHAQWRHGAIWGAWRAWLGSSLGSSQGHVAWRRALDRWAQAATEAGLGQWRVQTRSLRALQRRGRFTLGSLNLHRLALAWQAWRFFGHMRCALAARARHGVGHAARTQLGKAWNIWERHRQGQGAQETRKQVRVRQGRKRVNYRRKVMSEH